MPKQVAMLGLLKIFNSSFSLKFNLRRSRSDRLFVTNQEPILCLSVLALRRWCLNYLCRAYTCLGHSSRWFYSINKRKTWGLGDRTSNLTLTFLVSFHMSLWWVCVCFTICLISLALIGINIGKFCLSPYEIGVAVRSISIDFHFLPSIQC